MLATAAEAIYLIFIDRLDSKDKLKRKKSDLASDIGSSNIPSDNKLDFSWRTTLFSLLAIGAIGLFLRLYYFPQNVPLVLDALNSYFFYATDISILGHLPNWPVSNNGWPIFLSFFFSIFHYNDFLSYMNLQRIISVSLSLLTIIPAYFLCRKFFARSYSIIGTAIFAFEPHIIQNSLLGLTDPLFIILVASATVLFLRSTMKATFIAFAIIALASIVRVEGLFVFFAFSIAFFVTYRNDIRLMFKYVGAFAAFIVILLPMALLRVKIYGDDFLTTRAVSTTNSIAMAVIQTSKTGAANYLMTIENILKLGGWSLVPIFILLVPLGIFLMLKRNEQHRTAIFIIMVLMLIPVVVAFSEVQDTRYIYPLFPLFCVLSVLPIKKKLDNSKNRNLFLILIVAVVLSSGVAYLDVKKYDYEHQREAFGIATRVISIAKGINDYYPEDSYITPAQIPENWPTLKTSIQFKTSILPTTGFDSLEKYIESSTGKGLTHLVVDGAKNRPNFLNDVFYHEEKYPYLVKVFDSWDHGYKYHLKIYAIDFEKFNK